MGGAGRPAHDAALPQQAERGKVEVVVVSVGDEHDVGLGDRALERDGTAKVCDTAAQQRVGEQPNPVELDVHGGVPDVANDQ